MKPMGTKVAVMQRSVAIVPNGKYVSAKTESLFYIKDATPIKGNNAFNINSNIREKYEDRNFQNLCIKTSIPLMF